MRTLRTIILCLVLMGCAALRAQGQVTYTAASGAPSGACTTGIIVYTNLSNGDLYDCVGGVWHLTAMNTGVTIAAGAVTNSKLAPQAYMGFVLHSFCTGGSMAASSTVFMPGFGGVATTCTGLGTTRTSGTPVSAGTLKNLRVNLGTAGKAGDAVTVEVAGVASALTCTFGTGTNCADVTHSVTVTAGQVLTVKVATGASETAANIVVYFELWP